MTPKTNKTAKLQAESAPAESSSPPTPKGKLGVLLDLLKRDAGATLEDMTAATGWQAHSVRGAMSGALKKKLGVVILSEKSEMGRNYRIEAPAS